MIFDKQQGLLLGIDDSNLGRSFGRIQTDSGFVWLLCLLAFWAYLAVYTTGYLRDLVFWCSFVLPVVALKGGILSRIPWIARGGSILALAYVLWEIRSPVPGVIVLLRFAVVIIMLQLLSVHDNRSAYGVQILSLMIILAVAAMNVNFFFPMVVIPYLLTFYASLGKLSRIRHECLVAGAFFKKIALPAFWSRAIISSLFSIVFFFMLWLVIFYLIPRNESFSMASETSRRRLRGFSNTLNIGESGLLEDNPAVIMRVRPLQDKSLSFSILRRIRNKVLRGASFATYRDGSWERGKRRRWLVNLRKTQGELELKKRGAGFSDLHPLEFILENNDPPVIFIPDNTVSLSLSVPFVAMEEDFSFYFTSKTQAGRRYVANVIHNPVEPVDATFEQLTIEGSLNLYVNTDGVSPRVKDLSLSVASGALSINDLVARMIDYLHENCSYSLSQLPSRRDPVEEFLFYSRSGTCEHFASALAILLRCSGVPARPVGGYSLSEWNDVGGFFTVRQRHAHAWVEVYYPESGWVVVDPTPLAEEVSYETEVGRLLQTLWENYEGYWFTYVYNFDDKTQSAGFRKISISIAGLFDLSRLSALVVPVGLILSLFMAFFVFRRIFYSVNAVSGSWLPVVYRKWLSRQDYARHCFETPAEFHLRLQKNGVIDNESYKTLQKVAAIIDEIAFSEVGPDENRVAQLEQLLDQVRIAVRL